MSKKVCASRPSFSARLKASDVPIMEIPSNMLLAVFAAWPLPEGPAWKTFLPMASRMGLARSKSAASPPTIKVSVPAFAAATPPETGASNALKPCSTALLAALRASSTAMVEQSMSSASLLALASTPPSSKYTECTCIPAGSMVMMQAASATQSAASVAAMAPAATAFATA